LYVRQEAYYSAIPDGGKYSRAEQIERINLGIKDTEKKKSDDDSEEITIESPSVSIQELQEIPMPPLTEGCEYLVALLHSAGTAMATGMGLTGLTWQELKAWVECTDQVASPRDLQMIHTLSRAYANESHLATQKGAKPPYVPELSNEDLVEQRATIGEFIDDIFGSLLADQKVKPLSEEELQEQKLRKNRTLQIIRSDEQAAVPTTNQAAITVA
jgi:hypothetical protein